MKKNIYYLISLIGGTSIMVLEMAGFRMLAPYFGYSVYVSGALLSVVMLALSTGYLIGGIVADRSKTLKPLFLMMMVASVMVIIIRLFYVPFLNYLLYMPILTGSLVASFVIFTPPLFLMSTISPFLVKTYVKKGEVGIVSGRISAISTFGSIIGTLFASFYIIPEFGIDFTLNFLFFLIFIPSILGLVHLNKKFALTIVIALIPFLQETSFSEYPKAIQKNLDSKTAEVLEDIESKYSRIVTFYYPEKEAIAIRPSFRYVHSLLYENQLMTGEEWDYYALGGLIAKDTDDILILGTGSGTTLKILDYIYKDADITCLDIDEEMINAGLKYGGITPGENVEFVIEDARPYLRKTDKKFDLIAIDLFSGGHFIPFYLVTKEFFEILENSLTPNGVFVMNTNVFDNDSLLSKHIMNSASESFKSLFYARVAKHNTIVFGSKEDISIGKFKKLLADNETLELQNMIKVTLDNAIEFSPNKDYVFFTDKHAPVEQIIFKSIANN